MTSVRIKGAWARAGDRVVVTKADGQKYPAQINPDPDYVAERNGMAVIMYEGQAPAGSKAGALYAVAPDSVEPVA